ncbi:MAG TPA: hypothetical protein VJT32_09430 [bacterium]|nr:hypothetical protein [bacterium]
MPKPKNQQIFPWRPAAIYLAIVAVVAVALGAWEHAYEARQAGTAASLRPDVIARRLVENVVGAGTVQSSTLDAKTDTLTMKVKDVVSDQAKTPEQKRALLSGEGTQAVQGILGLISFKHIVLELEKDNAVEATVRAEPGKTPTTDFSPALK